MQITVNGEAHELAEGERLGALLTRLGVPRVGIAVEVNRTIVRRADHAEHVLAEGDQVEIVGLVGGG